MQTVWWEMCSNFCFLSHLLVYVLWRYPGLLPVFRTWAPVLQKLIAGAGKFHFSAWQQLCICVSQLWWEWCASPKISCCQAWWSLHVGFQMWNMGPVVLLLLWTIGLAQVKKYKKYAFFHFPQRYVNNFAPLVVLKGPCCCWQSCSINSRDAQLGYERERSVYSSHIHGLPLVSGF